MGMKLAGPRRESQTELGEVRWETSSERSRSSENFRSVSESIQAALTEYHRLGGL